MSAPTDEQPGPIRCANCPATFTSSLDLAQHRLDHHGLNPRLSWTGHICRWCRNPTPLDRATFDRIRAEAAEEARRSE